MFVTLVAVQIGGDPKQAKCLRSMRYYQRAMSNNTICESVDVFATVDYVQCSKPQYVTFGVAGSGVEHPWFVAHER